MMGRAVGKESVRPTWPLLLRWVCARGEALPGASGSGTGRVDKWAGWAVVFGSRGFARET